MILQPLIRRLLVRSKLAKAMVGATLTALIVSLGVVLVIRSMGMEIDAAVPSALGAISGGLFAAKLAVDTAKH